MQRISVTYYERRPRSAGNYSLESIYSDLRRRLAEHVDSTVRVAPVASNGFLPRLKILLNAWRYRREAIHFTGDIHFAAIVARKKNAILTIHDCGGLIEQRGLGAALLKFFWYKIPIMRVARVTTVSEATKREILLLTGCAPEKISVIRNSVSDQFARFDKDFDEKSPRILQVGTAFNKNIERLVQALAGFSCSLVVIGELSPSQKARIEQVGIRLENKVGLTRKQLIDEYRGCDIVAFASTFEGFGMPIVEAQIVGRPVVTSNCSSMPEVAGNSACFVNPLDVNSIQEGFQRVIRDREYRNELIELGFKNAKRFDADEIAQQYLQLYWDVFGKACISRD